jgi:hypothetical protein
MAVDFLEQAQRRCRRGFFFLTLTLQGQPIKVVIDKFLGAQDPNEQLVGVKVQTPVLVLQQVNYIMPLHLSFRLVLKILKDHLLNRCVASLQAEGTSHA